MVRVGRLSAVVVLDGSGSSAVPFASALHPVADTIVSSAMIDSAEGFRRGNIAGD